MGEVRVSLAFLVRVSGIADDVREIDWIHLADDHPGEEHAQRGQPLLDGGPGTGLRLGSTKLVTCAGPNWAKKVENWRTA
jgi:hypothetical protein